jgi:glycosyltransferase involved in cell wall biosynthesis
MDISVVIPVYNEEESVEPLCRELHGALSGLGKSYEILLVDDGSTDETWNRLVGLRGQFPGVGLTRFRRNFGQTAAMSAGFHQARGDVIVTLDADLQNDPADIPKLLEKMEPGVDVVSGWRKDRKDRFLDRRLPSILANRIIGRITGVGIHDFGCTLKAYRREVIQNVHLYGEMHRFIPALAFWVGGRVVEVEVNHRAREYGTSKYGMARTLRVVLDLVTVKFLMRYSTGPIQIFGKIAVMFFLPGLLLLGFMMFANLLHHLNIPNAADDMIKRPFWVMTCFFLIFMGMQFISMGLLAEMQVRTYHESQGKPIYVVRESLEPSN